MNRAFWLILSALLVANIARCGELIPDICWFDAPPGMEHFVEPNDPGDNPFSMESKAIEFQSGNQPANIRAITFSLRLIGATIGQGKTLTISPVSDEQLKQFMASEFDQKITNATKVQEVTLAGQKALKIQAPLKEFYWVRVRPNKVLVIRLFGGNEALLNSARSELSSLKIKVSNESDSPLQRLAKDEVQLGISKEETRKRCGEPFEQSGPDEYYIAPKYLIEVQFRNPNDENVSFIGYTKLRDSKKFLEAPSHEALKAQVQPIDGTLAEEILAHQTDGGKLKWTSIAKDRWKRSDGAMAALTSQGLTIATAAAWPNIHLIE